MTKWDGVSPIKMGDEVAKIEDPYKKVTILTVDRPAETGNPVLTMDKEGHIYYYTKKGTGHNKRYDLVPLKTPPREFWLNIYKDDRLEGEYMGSRFPTKQEAVDWANNSPNLVKTAFFREVEE